MSKVPTCKVSEKIVPREPTPKMAAVADDMNPPFGAPERLTDEYCAEWRVRARKSFISIWQAMYDAAPTASEADKLEQEQQ